MTDEIRAESADKIYKCPVGHRWAGTPSWKGVGMEISLPNGTILTTGSLCPYCLVNWLKKNFGPVTEASMV